MTTLLLLSGGIDSTCVALMTRPDHCLTVDYGQRAASAELVAAKAVADSMRIPQTSIKLPAHDIGSGLMSASPSKVQAPIEVSPEWWPFRNQLLVTAAAAWGVTRGYETIKLGSVAGDGDRHADGTQAFRDAISTLLQLQEGKMLLEAPAAQMSTLELIKASRASEGLLAWTHSCHQANTPCMRCPGCLKRRDVLGATGLLS